MSASDLLLLTSINNERTFSPIGIDTMSRPGSTAVRPLTRLSLPSCSIVCMSSIVCGMYFEIPHAPGLEDSISGSESSSSGESDESDAVATLVNRRKRVERSTSPSDNTRTLPQTALAWFHSPPSTQIGVYRALFPSGTAESSYLSALKNMQTRRENGRTWAMFMVAGGHFAGAIVQVSRPMEEDEDEDDAKGRRKKAKKPKPDNEVLLHKTFHRYTSESEQFKSAFFLNISGST